MKVTINTLLSLCCPRGCIETSKGFDAAIRFVKGVFPFSDQNDDA